MGRSSTRENKTRYQLAREELGLSREKASELLETIAPERIEKIESERSLPRPDEVLIMEVIEDEEGEATLQPLETEEELEAAWEVFEELYNAECDGDCEDCDAEDCDDRE